VSWNWDIHRLRLPNLTNLTRYECNATMAAIGVCAKIARISSMMTQFRHESALRGGRVLPDKAALLFPLPFWGYHSLRPVLAGLPGHGDYWDCRWVAPMFLIAHQRRTKCRRVNARGTAIGPLLWRCLVSLNAEGIPGAGPAPPRKGLRCS